MRLFGKHEAWLLWRQDLRFSAIATLQPEPALEHADHAPHAGLRPVLAAELAKTAA